jgi:hypothetical protein
MLELNQQQSQLAVDLITNGADPLLNDLYLDAVSEHDTFFLNDQLSGQWCTWKIDRPMLLTSASDPTQHVIVARIRERNNERAASLGWARACSDGLDSETYRAFTLTDFVPVKTYYLAPTIDSVLLTFDRNEYETMAAKRNARHLYHVWQGGGDLGNRSNWQRVYTQRLKHTNILGAKRNATLEKFVDWRGDAVTLITNKNGKSQRLYLDDDGQGLYVNSYFGWELDRK